MEVTKCVLREGFSSYTTVTKLERLEPGYKPCMYTLAG